MCSMKADKSYKINIIYLALLVIYGVVALISIIMVYNHENVLIGNTDFVGFFLLLSSIPSILISFLRGGLKQGRLIPYFVFGIVGVAFGIYAMITNVVPINVICICWGAFDICRSLYEVFDVFTGLRNKNWLKAVELIVATAEIVIAVFLIVKQFEAFKVHVKFIGFSFIVLLLNEIIILLVGKKNEKGISRN